MQFVATSSNLVVSGEYRQVVPSTYQMYRVTAKMHWN